MAFSNDPVPIEFLDEEQEKRLCSELEDELRAALENHEAREERYARYLKLYKAKPEQPRKTFPWDGAANVVVPLVAIAVDSISARLQRAIFLQKDAVEVQIKNPQAEALEKPLREYLTNYLKVTCQQALGTIFFDQPLYGDAFVKLLWEDKKRVYHSWSTDGEKQSQEIQEFKGVKWYVIHPSDVIRPDGYDSFEDAPWIAHRLRLTWRELKQRVKEGLYDEEKVELLKNHEKERKDPHFRLITGQKRETRSSVKFFELYEIHGVFEVPSESNPEETDFEEVILTYSLDRNVLLRAIYNPYFGKARHIVRIPFLKQPHEMDAMGIAEQIELFQESATASHNQVLDAGTAANAGIIATSPHTNFGDNEEIYPGKRVTCEKPHEEIAVIRLSEASPTLGMMEQRAMQYAEKRTGVGAYQLGQESPIVGSQATATGTTALISEGNIRFWVSIDDMRRALEQLLYLTLQQIQQFAPEGIAAPSGQLIVLPQGDPRQSIGLTLAVSSEVMNRELELRNIQMLVQMLNEYYMRIMQASAVIQNPALPPLQKVIIMQVMDSAHDLMKRLVERFDLENVDTIVPNLMNALQQVMGVMRDQTGMAGLGLGGPPALPPGAGGPVQPGSPQAGGGVGPGPGVPPPSGVELPA